MLRMCVLPLVAMLLFFAFPIQANTSFAQSERAKDECLAVVMQAGAGELTRIQPNKMAEACQSFPLSDDVFVQVLAGLVGEPIIVLLDVYTALSSKPHGFDESSAIFSIGKPFQQVMLAANLFFFSVFIIVVLSSIFMQALRWQKGEVRLTFREWFNRHGSNYGVSGFLSLPVIGWMTPLQAFAVVVILLLGALAKWIVTYLFLASFFGGTSIAIQSELKDELALDYGRAVVLHNCDLQRREVLVKHIQGQIGSRSELDLQENPLYQCLTSGGDTNRQQQVPSGTEGSVVFSVTPAALINTDRCVDQHRDLLREWGVATPSACGAVQFTLPNNQSAPGSINNAVSLYFSDGIAASLRDIALKLHEYNCRAYGKVPKYDGVEVASCMIASPSGSGYTYQFASDVITAENKLDYYKTAMSEATREQFAITTKTALLGLNQQLTNRPEALLAHLNDLLAPPADISEESSSAQKRRVALSQRLNQRLQETGTLGFSREDAEFLVSNIQRGPWTASSLFYGSLADGVSESAVVEVLSNVFSVPSYSGEGFLNTDLLAIQDMQSVTKKQFNNPLDDAVAQGAFIVPRLGLYLDNVECWYRQSACTTPPLNPFSYLGQRGAQLIDEASARYLGGVVLQRLARMFFGFSKHQHSRFMVLDTIGEFQLLYLILGVILAIIIPLIPMLKLLAMMINWCYDVVRELFSIQYKVCISPMGDQGSQFLSDDVREALARLAGLGLYYLFIMVGLVVMFLMYSFLFAMNVFLVGMLSSVVSWGGGFGAIDTMVTNIIFDAIIAFLLLYQVIKCTPYIEKIPRAMADHFGVRLTESDSITGQFFDFTKRHVAPGVSRFIHKLGAKVG